MNKWIVGLVAGLVAGAAFGGSRVIEKMPRADGGTITYTVISYVETNKVDKGIYEGRTNGYSWTENADVFPRAVPQNDATFTKGEWNLFANAGNFACVTNVVYFSSVNMSMHNAPDPFEEKITVSFFTVVSNDVYSVVVGPLITKYATQRTIVDRWYTVKKQKLNMTESSETIRK